MKDNKPPKKGLDIKTFAVIVLIVLTGISFAFCAISATERRWIEFSIFLAATLVLIIITCPLAYKGDMFECPKCKHKFRVNPYKVFFTNGILQTFDFDGQPMKYAKLKCPNCKTKDWCKWHREQL